MFQRLMILLCIGLMGAMSPAGAQTPPVSVPAESQIVADEANLALKKDLDQRYQTLLQEFNKWNADATAFNGTYGGKNLDADTQEAKDGLAEQARVSQALEAYQSQADQFKNDVGRLRLMSFADILTQERQHIYPDETERLEHINPLTKAVRQHLSDMVYASFERHYGFVNDPALQSRLNTLLNRLRTATPYPDEPIELKILDAPKFPEQTQVVGEEVVFLGADRNVQVAGNIVYVGRNYLERNPPPTDDEILFVLGHELGHYDRDHGTMKAIKVIADDLESVPGLALNPDQTTLSPKQRAVVRDQAMKADWLAEYTRSQESEADRDGAYLAMAAGAKPDGISQAFDWMRMEEASHTPKNLKGQELPVTSAETKRVELTRDHPEPEERFKALQQIYGTPLGTLTSPP